MTGIESFHCTRGGTAFLGLRRDRSGQAEIVYDNGPSQRQIWRVLGDVADEASLCEAMRLAMTQARILPALFQQLNTRAITIEAVGA